MTQLGQPLVKRLAANSILRRLPSVVDAEQRFRTDTLLFCHDVMVAAHQRLTHACMLFEVSHPDTQQVVSMISDAWLIIDQVNVVRQILGSSNGENGPITKAFLEEAGAARAMRNGMDHLPQNLRNRTQVRGHAEALFGMLSYVRCQPSVLDVAVFGEPLTADVILVARGTVPRLKGAGQAQFDTGAVTRPISNLKINAFGATYALDRACEQLTDILLGMEDSVGSSIGDQALAMAEETGVPIEKIMSSTPTTVVAHVSATFPYGPTTEIHV